ncbi:MAG: hypothetical protein FWD71_01965 [Oscillospiraceae bacterium]|nr:hypothetical protein [Oscillospiraceae bacterium]
MKRFTALILIAVFTAVMFAGCGGGGGNGSIKTGLGVVTDVSSSKAATADAAGQVQINSYVADVTLDSKGIIQKCSIDAVQSKINFDATGALTTDLTAPVQSKNELKENYGMGKQSPIGKEWYQQADAFAQWCIGKTLNEVKGIKTKAGSETGSVVADVPELTSSVTISISDFLSAIEKAVNNAQSATVSGSYKTGQGISTSIASSKSATADAAGLGQADSYIAVVTVDDSGKIVACTLDSAQTKVNFDATGALTTDLTAVIQTKDELKEAYGMGKQSPIGKEWYQQADAFAQWCIGKTLDEVKGLKTKAGSETGSVVADDPDLASSVTIDVTGFLASIEKAVNNAK